MARISDIVTRHCLVWNTERPYMDAPRESSNFSLLGFEWNFELCLLFNSGSSYYKISLQKVTDEEPLETDLTISTFIHGSIGGTCLCNLHTGRSAKRVIWSCRKDIADQHMNSLCYSRICRIIFCIDTPCMLQQSRSETEHDTLGTVENKCAKASTIDISPGMESLSHDLSQLLEHKIFPDVQLRCGDRSIRAHKCILASRSDVFAAMFRNKMAESETGTVDVTDMDADVFDLFLKYVYSGKIPDLSGDTASSLYAAADKYSIHALKKACSDWMVGGLTAENCLDFLILAEVHSDEDFKDRVVSFVAENLESLGKQAWFEFNKDHPGLAISVYQMFAASTLSMQT